MYNLTYDLWNKIIDDIIDIHTPLFEAMQNIGGNLKITKDLVEELKSNGYKDIKEGQWQFLLSIELYDDDIGGFNVALLSAESREAFEEVVMSIAEDLRVSLEDISGFEAEHGLDMADEVFDKIEEKYNINPEIAEEGIVYQLVIFDSEDIDNNQNSKKTWF